MSRIATLVTGLCLLVSPLLASRPDPAPPVTESRAEASWLRHQELDAESPFRGLPWRCVGPVIQGGRIVDLEVDPRAPYTFYAAYASGGLWKTTNNGMSFEPLFDDQRTIIIGDLAIDPNQPDTLWLGTGENNSSRSSYGGAGVFRSNDAGKTWHHMGLFETDRIGRILVDPNDSDHILVAALGRLYTDSGERGIFRSTDGGRTWANVQSGEGWTGFIDLVRHPTHTEILYASSWDRKRHAWNFEEGGEGSGIWKSTDNGAHWNRLEGGFPRGEQVGRVGLAVSPDSPDTLYAFLDNQELLPEEDWDLGGAAVSPKRMRGMSKDEFLSQNPEEIEDFLRNNDLDHNLTAKKLIKMVKDDELSVADLIDRIRDANANLFDTDIKGAEVWRSDDAGKTFSKTHDTPIRELVYSYGYYFGQIRAAPDDADRIYIMGVPMLTSTDGGKTWSNINTPDVHVDHHDLWIDPALPKHLMLGNDGGFYQSFDGGKSWLALNGIPVGQIYDVSLDDAEPFNIYVGLQDNGVYKGSSEHRIGEDGNWKRVGGGDGMYTQIDSRDGTFYWGYQFGNYFRVGGSSKGGRVKPWTKLDEEPLRFNWNTPIQLSPHHQDVLYFGANKLFRSLDQGRTFEAISEDLTESPERGDVPFGTITVLSESKERFGLIWAGTDDGKVWVTRDGGAEWHDVSGGLPRDRWVSRVEPSIHDEETGYLTLNGYRNDDPTAYVYRTEDLGATWVSIAAGLPEEAVNVIREDPINADVLYVGTDRGAYASLDRGASWTSLSVGLPNVPVHDMKVHPTQRHLVAATHGRSAWVIDALPIQELTAEVREEPIAIFPVEAMTWKGSWKQQRSTWWFREKDAPRLKIPFWIKEGGEVTLQVEDEDGRELARRTVSAEPGIALIEWDLLLDEGPALASTLR